MGSKSINSLSSLVLELLCRFAQCASCVDHVINDDHIFVSHIPYEVHSLNFPSILSLLHNHGHRYFWIPFANESLLEQFSSYNSSSIWRDDDAVVEVLNLAVFDDEVYSRRTCCEVINGDVMGEESHSLPRVKIHAEHLINPRHF